MGVASVSEPCSARVWLVAHCSWQRAKWGIDKWKRGAEGKNSVSENHAEVWRVDCDEKKRLL